MVHMKETIVALLLCFVVSPLARSQERAPTTAQPPTTEAPPAWLGAPELATPRATPKPPRPPKRDRKIYLRGSGGIVIPTRGVSQLLGKGAFDLEFHLQELDGILLGLNASTVVSGDGYLLTGNGLLGMYARVFETDDWIGHGSVTVLAGGGGGSFGGTGSFEARCELRALGWRTLEAFLQFGFLQYRDNSMLTVGLGLSLAFL